MAIEDHIRELFLGRDIHLNTREALRLLAARVEALEQRTGLRITVDPTRDFDREAAERMVDAALRESKQPAASGGPKREPSTANYPLFEYMSGAHRLTLLESELDEIVRVVHKMTGGPKREALPSPLDQWGDPPFPAEATPKPNPDLWSSCAPKPCTFCGEVTTTSYNAVPMHRGCNRPAPPDAGTQEAEATTLWEATRRAALHALSIAIHDDIENQTTHPEVLRAHRILAANKHNDEWHAKAENTQQPTPPAAPERQEKLGVDDAYEQWKLTAIYPTSPREAFWAGAEWHQKQQPDRWRDAALLVDKWRAQADQLNRDFPGYQKCEEKADLLRICADQLAALLPPEKEAKS